jgi:hypothetical protein
VEILWMLVCKSCGEPDSENISGASSPASSPPAFDEGLPSRHVRLIAGNSGVRSIALPNRIAQEKT